MRVIDAARQAGEPAPGRPTLVRSLLATSLLTHVGGDPWPVPHGDELPRSGHCSLFVQHARHDLTFRNVSDQPIFTQTEYS